MVALGENNNNQTKSTKNPQQKCQKDLETIKQLYKTKKLINVFFCISSLLLLCIK